MRFFPENRNVTCSTKNYLDVQSSRRCPHVLKENFCMDLAACQKMAQNPCRWSSKWKRESNVPPRMTAARGRCYKAPEKESWPTYCSRSGPNIQAATFPSLERRMPQVKEVYPKCTDVYNSSVILQKCCPSPKTYASVLKAEPKESDIVSDTTEKPRMVQSSDNKRENPLATKCQKLFAGTFKFCEQNISDNVAEFDHCPRKGSNSKVLNKMDDLRQLLHNATTVQIQKSPEISPIKGNVTKEGCKQTSPRSRSNSIDLSKVAACFVIPQATVCGSPTKESLLQNGYGNTTQQDMLCSNSAIAFIMGIGLSDLEDSDDDSDWDSSDDDDPWISIEAHFRDEPMCTKKEPNLEDSVDQVSPLTLQSKVPKDVADGEEHRSPTHDQSLDELLTEANRKWNDVYGDVSPHVSSKKLHDDVFDSCHHPRYSYWVTFANDNKLCKVNSVEVFCRKGEWEQYARDRERFQKRILDVGLVISPVLENEFRTKIFKSRVAPSQDLPENTLCELRTEGPLQDILKSQPISSNT